MAALTLAGVLATDGEAAARCQDPGDLASSAGGVRQDLSCRLEVLLGDESACAAPNVPPCAATLPARAAQILLGDEGGPVSGWTTASLRCQRQVVLSGMRFLRSRLGERSRGQRRAGVSRSLRRRIERGCRDAVVAQNASGDTLPRVGGVCADVVGAAGDFVDAAALARCVRAALEGVVDDIAPTPLRPNILLVLTDDQRFDTLDGMPVTSALRDEGLSFPNAFVTNPVCTPSRASVLTGRYSKNNGVLHNGHFASLDDSDTIARRLDDAGYTTGLFGKYVNNSESLGPTPPRGWDEWKSFLNVSGGEFYGFHLNDNGVFRQYGKNQYSTDWLAREAARFVRRNADRPFFLAFTPFAPHGPATPARRHRDALRDVPLHRPPSWFGDVTGKPTWVRFMKSITSPDKRFVMDQFREDQLRTLLSVDEAVARLLEALERRGLADNTVVVFTSDHGYPWGEHWLTNKFNPYEESIRVPYVLRYPRRYPRPQVREEMVLNIDLAPTFLDFAGLDVPPDLDGASLATLLESTGEDWREEFLIETAGAFIEQPSESVRTASFKYIDTLVSAGVTEELYDLAADPYETTNVATETAYADVLADMRARLDALRTP